MLEDSTHFDAPFFRMNRREAAMTDPQQRMFLECTWEALETAGYLSHLNQTKRAPGDELSHTIDAQNDLIADISMSSATSSASSSRVGVYSTVSINN